MGSDTPDEVFWTLNSLLIWAKNKGFKSDIDEFNDPLYHDNDEEIYKSNDALIEQLVEFFDNLK